MKAKCTESTLEKPPYVIILDEIKMLYREGGEEFERTFGKGEVFWIDPVKHDHKALTTGSAMLVSLK